MARAGEGTGPLPSLERWRVPLAFAWLAVLAWLTLLPLPGGRGGPFISPLCLVCGDRGTADAILNVALFAPLGALLALGGMRARKALLLGAAVSVGVELAQVAVPGRYPTLGDVAWNGLGAGLGAVVWAGAVRHFVEGGGRSPLAGPPAALAAGIWIGLAGWLLAPASTRATYYGQWTPDLGHMPRYEGTLLSATLDGLAIPDTRFPASARPRERLEGDWTVSARVVKGPAPAAVSPIVSVYDADRVEIFLLGSHGEDLVLREHTRAKAVRLDHPDLRLPAALAGFEPGDTLELEARRMGTERCLGAGGRVECGLGFTPGRTWGLLLYLEGPAEAARRVLDVAWLALLTFPVGLLSVSRRQLVGGGALFAAGVAVAVWTTRLLAPPWWEVAGGLAGLVAGRACAALLARALGRRGPSGLDRL